jgi:hypothetical protein
VAGVTTGAAVLLLVAELLSFIDDVGLPVDAEETGTSEMVGRNEEDDGEEKGEEEGT